MSNGQLQDSSDSKKRERERETYVWQISLLLVRKTIWLDASVRDSQWMLDVTHDFPHRARRAFVLKSPAMAWKVLDLRRTTLFTSYTLSRGEEATVHENIHPKSWIYRKIHPPVSVKALLEPNAAGPETKRKTLPQAHTKSCLTQSHNIWCNTGIVFIWTLPLKLCVMLLQNT